MDPTEPNLLPQLWDSAMNGAGMLLLMVGVVIASAFVVVGGFVIVDRRHGDRRSGRGRAQWHEDRKRKQQELLHRIRAYAQARQNAVASGAELPNDALQSLKNYGQGVADTIACSMRSEQQIEAVRRLVDKELAVLEQSTRRVQVERKA